MSPRCYAAAIYGHADAAAIDACQLPCCFAIDVILLFRCHAIADAAIISPPLQRRYAMMLMLMPLLSATSTDAGAIHAAAAAMLIRYTFRACLADMPCYYAATV